MAEWPRCSKAVAISAGFVHKRVELAGDMRRWTTSRVLVTHGNTRRGHILSRGTQVQAKVQRRFRSDPR